MNNLKNVYYLCITGIHYIICWLRLRVKRETSSQDKKMKP